MTAKKKQASRNANTFLPGFLLQENSPFSIQEAYKSLRTNLSYAVPGNRKNLIFGITSSNIGEGKSASALNLAMSYATLHKKVLLIDCDLRRPSIAQKLKQRRIAGTIGLTEFLTGKAGLNACIQPVPGTSLHVLPSGMIPPDATALLESEEMGLLFETLKEEYEIIILDLPPVLSVTDASILSEYVDGLLLVVRHNSTHIDSVEETIRQLRLVNAKVLGFLYNDVPPESKKYGSKYYVSSKR